jgi:hypothetical protein
VETSTFLDYVLQHRRIRMKLRIKRMALPFLVCTAVLAMMLAMTISAGASAETGDLAAGETAASEDVNWRLDETVSLDNGQTPTIAVGGSTTPFGANLTPWVILAAFGGLVLIGAGFLWRRKVAS